MDKIIGCVGRKIVDFLINNNFVQNEQKEAFQYGAIVTIQSIINWIAVMIVGLLFDMFWENLCFFITYKFLRKFTGGLHASEFSFCFMISVLLNIAILFFVQYLKMHSCYTLIIIFEICSFIIVMVLAPIINSNKLISTKEKMIYKSISIVLSIILLILSVVLIKCRCKYVFSIAMSFSLNGILMILGVLEKRIKNQE